MPLKIPASARRYAVSARPRLDLGALCERLARRRFVGLDPDSPEDERSGWVTVEHLLDTRFDLDRCVREPYLVFALRTDRRRVPAQLVRAELRVQEDAHRAAKGKRMSPTERREAREAIQAALARRALPHPSAVPVLWNLPGQRVYFGSAGAHPNDLFKACFEDTFELTLTALGPLGAAEIAAQGREELVRAVSALAPARFDGGRPAQPLGAPRAARVA
jgi:hypothetical protein